MHMQEAHFNQKLTHTHYVNIFVPNSVPLAFSFQFIYTYKGYKTISWILNSRKIVTMYKIHFMYNQKIIELLTTDSVYHNRNHSSGPGKIFK